MVKLVPEAVVHADDLAWRPWEGDRKAPFVAEGVQGRAWVKVLSRDPETGAESLLYRLDRGWSASHIESTVYENLVVVDGEVEAGGVTLRRHAYSYRPEGHRIDGVSSPTGATVIAYAGAPGELSSPTAVPRVDVDSMAWSVYPVPLPNARYELKMLRGDEENLDMFFLMRSARGLQSHHVSAHDAPEEGFFLAGRTEFYDGVTEGRLIATKGTYIHRGPWSKHGHLDIVEDQTIFVHDYFFGETEEIKEIFLAAYPRETEAVSALRAGRDPGLAKRW
jgi:hypothetical protein